MRALIGVEPPSYRPVDVDTWANDDGDVLSVHFFELPPDLPAGLDDGPTLHHTLTHYTAQAGGGLIEASVKTLGGLPALRQILKLPLPGRPNGQAFIGSFTVPRAGCSTVVKIQAAETGCGKRWYLRRSAWSSTSGRTPTPPTSRADCRSMRRTTNGGTRSSPTTP